MNIVQEHILTSSSLSLFLVSWTVFFKFCVNAIAYNIATGSGTIIVGFSFSGRATSFLITKRHVSQGWRHEQQLSSIGLRRQVLRSRGISRSLCLSQPDVRIRVGDVEKLQFLSEFGESGCFTASDKVWCSSTITTRSVVRLRTPTRIKTSASWRGSHFRFTWQSWWLIFTTWSLQLSKIRLQLCLPASHSNTVDRCLEMDDRV